MADTAIDVRKAPLPAQQRREGKPDFWSAFRTEVDRLFDQFDGGPRGILDVPFLSPSGGFQFRAPAVDLEENEAAYRITAELPGLDEKEIEVSLSGDMLLLKGEKSEAREEKEKNRYLAERRYGAFQRRFRIPDDVDREKVTATLAKGVLAVDLPKTAESRRQARKVEVKAT